jgi:hypothetical protein
MSHSNGIVTSAQAGAHALEEWIPACAGMTVLKTSDRDTL